MSDRLPFSVCGRTALAIVAVGTATSLTACSQSTRAPVAPTTQAYPAQSFGPTSQARAAQRLVDECTAVFDAARMRPEYSSIRNELQDARGVIIFPRVNGAISARNSSSPTVVGVAMARDAAGAWSAPIFVTMNASAPGSRLGYSSVVLVLNHRAYLDELTDRGLFITANTDVTTAWIAPDGAGLGAPTLTLDAPLTAVFVTSRRDFDIDYYGLSANTQRILSGDLDKTGTDFLRRSAAMASLPASAPEQPA